MANPFPGIDPYIEDQKFWADFHPSFLTYLRDAINDRLPDRYDANLEERFTISSSEGDEEFRPDLAVLRVEGTGPARGGAAVAAVAEPVTVPLPGPAVEEINERWIEVARRDDRSVVAVIEVLSPSNKVGEGRQRHLAKRGRLLAQPIHLVELDFLLDGRRLPMGAPLPAGDFYALVARSGRRPDCDVYAWSIRRPLPPIRLPLDPPDPDIRVDLAEVYATAHLRGRYGRKARRDRPPQLPLATDDLAWASARGREAGP